MTLLEKMCEELGIEIGEEWQGNDGQYYVINQDGNLDRKEYFDNLEEDVLTSEDDIGRVLTGKLKPKWKPKNWEPCYIADPSLKVMYDMHHWFNNSEYHKMIWERGLVFKTKEEAVKCAEEMIALAKQGI